jgi:hypothetical protein
MNLPIAVRVPETDRADLESLMAEVDADADSISAARPFDGETVVQGVLVLSGVVYPYFRSWLTQRGSARKSFSVIHNGTELKGYTREEALAILEKLDRTAHNASPGATVDEGS